MSEAKPRWCPRVDVLRVELHHEVPDDTRLREIWNALVLRSSCPEVFYTHEWAKAVHCAYGKTLHPWVLLGYEGEDLVGVAAMAFDSNNRVTFLSGTTADYCDFLALPDKRMTFFDNVFSELLRAGFETIVLANLPADSESHSLLPAIGRKHGLHVFSRLGYVCARVELGSSEERSQLKRSLHKKKNLRYGMNSFAKEGPVALQHITSWPEAEVALPEFYVAHVARFLATNRISNLARADRRVFVAELSRRLSAAGWLAVTKLMVGQRPIAWNYGFRFQGSWFYYQPTFESRLEHFSPGQCLLAAMITDACDSAEVQLVDLGLGAEGYKERFANNSRTTLHVTFSRSRMRHFQVVTRYRLAERVKQSPRFESTIRTTLSRIALAWHDSGSHGLGWSKPTRRLRRSVALDHQIQLYEWKGTVLGEVNEPEDLNLCPLDLNLLAKATMIYEGDDETWSYLLASAQRLKAAKWRGLVLVLPDRKPVHFCWVAPLNGFFIPELQSTLLRQEEAAMLIFDCHTPMSERNEAHLSTALRCFAQDLAKEGRVPWILCAAGNPSQSSTERAGFVLRHATVSRRTPRGLQVTRTGLVSPKDEKAVSQS